MTSYIELQDELASANAKIQELLADKISTNEQITALRLEAIGLQDELHETNKSHKIALEASESYLWTMRRQENANKRIIDTLNTVVNRLLRQTIAQYTHRDRNMELRDLCRDVLQILEIAHDEYPYEDIPF